MGILQVAFLFCSSLYLTGIIKAQQLITQPPVNTTAALDTNVTFSCHGNGCVLWEINSTQLINPDHVPQFKVAGVYPPLPRPNYSELIITATHSNNNTRIQCVVEQGSSGSGNTNKSDEVILFVFAEPNRPVGLNVTVDGLNLVATWNEPFALDGEELSYVISITNTASGVQNEVTAVNTSRYVLIEPIGERDCAEYQFVVFSENGYSRSKTNISGLGHIPTVPLVMKRSDVRINVSLVEEIQVIITFSPPDPCPSYPVISYTFNISEDNNFIATINHDTGNSSVNINGSNHGLVRDHVYLLIIGAMNNVGRTASEEILLYTTGLQSSIAVMELNGSITVTCIFATGASSTGCQVAILEEMNDTGLKRLDTFNITRRNGATKIARNLNINGLMNYHTLLVQAVELLSGGKVGNITINGTVSPPIIIPPVNPPIQALSEGIIIGVVVSILLVLLLLIIATISVIISLRKRRQGQTPSGQTTYGDRYVKPVLTEPAYETIKLCQGTKLCTQTIDNPVYGSENKVTESDIGYAEISNATRGQIVSHMAGYQVLDPKTTAPLSLSPLTSEKEFVNQVPSPYLIPQQSFGKENKKEQYKMQASMDSAGYQQISDPKSQTGGKTEQSTAYINTHVVPADPQTGYSTLLRADKIKPSSTALGSVSPLYESIKEKENGFLVGSKGDRDKVIVGISMSTTQGTSPTNNPPTSDKPISCDSQLPQPEVSITATVPINDDPETGYSRLRPDKVLRPPQGCSVPLYDTIKLNSSISLEQHSSNVEDTSQTNESSLQTSSDGHNHTAVRLGESTSPDT